jgi:hypothetical protein
MSMLLTAERAVFMNLSRPDQEPQYFGSFLVRVSEKLEQKETAILCGTEEKTIATSADQNPFLDASRFGGLARFCVINGSRVVSYDDKRDRQKAFRHLAVSRGVSF